MKRPGSCLKPRANIRWREPCATATLPRQIPSAANMSAIACSRRWPKGQRCSLTLCSLHLERSERSLSPEDPDGLADDHSKGLVWGDVDRILSCRVLTSTCCSGENSLTLHGKGHLTGSFDFGLAPPCGRSACAQDERVTIVLILPGNSRSRRNRNHTQRTARAVDNLQRRGDHHGACSRQVIQIT